MFDFRIVPTVWYFRIVSTMWYFRIVPTVRYFRIVSTVWYFRIVSTVWYFHFYFHFITQTLIFTMSKQYTLHFQDILFTIYKHDSRHIKIVLNGEIYKGKTKDLRHDIH